jgi:hypothetical protein
VVAAVVSAAVATLAPGTCRDWPMPSRSSTISFDGCGRGDGARHRAASAVVVKNGDRASVRSIAALTFGSHHGMDAGAKTSKPMSKVPRIFIPSG